MKGQPSMSLVDDEFIDVCTDAVISDRESHPLDAVFSALSARGFGVRLECDEHSVPRTLFVFRALPKKAACTITFVDELVFASAHYPEVRS